MVGFAVVVATGMLLKCCVSTTPVIVNKIRRKEAAKSYLVSESAFTPCVQAKFTLFSSICVTNGRVDVRREVIRVI
jgi:hypothetical protein